MHRTEEDIKKEAQDLKAENKRLSDELREARHELEIRVKVRTAEIAKANEDLHRDIAERKEIGEKFRTVINSTPDGFWIIDLEGKFLEVNPAICRMLDYSPQEMSKMKVADIEAIESVQDVLQHIEKIREFGSDRFETKLRRKDGILIDVEVSTSFVTNSSREEGIFAFVRDITERKQARKNLVKLNKEILEANKKLEQLTVKDSYTGLYNHRYLEEIIEAEFNRARRYGNPFSVIMLDIDYFKSINDVYGHQFGDVVLKQLAEQLKKHLRRYDVVIRYGGEEFVVLSPLTDRPTALILAQRLLESINLHNFGNRKHVVKLKLSIAVASYPEDRIIKGMDLIELAEQMLNCAKESGGNRVYSFLDRGKGKHKSLIKNGREPSGIKFLREKIEKLNKRANQSLIEAIFAFAKAIESNDKHTGRHVEMTVKYATEAAKKIELSVEEIENIREAAILHDLGKIGISEKILLKRSKLTKEEFEEIKKHPQIGVDIIRPLHFLHDIIPLILYHHERWDGNGYPHGLKGEDIPIGARIIAVADAYQALISNRPYRKAYSKEKALKIIKIESGTHFDSVVVNTFLEILRENK